MTGSYYLHSLKAVASCCMLAFLIGCAETKPKPSLHRPDIVPVSKITTRPQVYLTVKEGVQPEQIRNFVEYLGCKIIENIPEGGNVYVVEVPSKVNLKSVMAKFEIHPWIILATTQQGKKN